MSEWYEPDALCVGEFLMEEQILSAIDRYWVWNFIHTVFGDSVRIICDAEGHLNIDKFGIYLDGATYKLCVGVYHSQTWDEPSFYDIVDVDDGSSQDLSEVAQKLIQCIVDDRLANQLENYWYHCEEIRDQTMRILED